MKWKWLEGHAILVSTDSKPGSCKVGVKRNLDSGGEHDEIKLVRVKKSKTQDLSKDLFIQMVKAEDQHC